MSRRDSVKVEVSVRNLRGSLGMTQVVFADLLGIHPMTVSKWERGIASPSQHLKRRMLETYFEHQGAGTIGATEYELEPPSTRLGNHSSVGLSELPSSALLHSSRGAKQ